MKSGFLFSFSSFVMRLCVKNVYLLKKMSHEEKIG